MATVFTVPDQALLDCGRSYTTLSSLSPISIIWSEMWSRKHIIVLSSMHPSGLDTQKGKHYELRWASNFLTEEAIPWTPKRADQKKELSNLFSLLYDSPQVKDLGFQWDFWGTDFHIESESEEHLHCFPSQTCLTKEVGTRLNFLLPKSFSSTLPDSSCIRFTLGCSWTCNSEIKERWKEGEKG